MKLNFRFTKETKGCYRFDTEQGPEWTALYLKKNAVVAAGIDPFGGITVTIAAADSEPSAAKPRFGFGKG